MAKRVSSGLILGALSLGLLLACSADKDSTNDSAKDSPYREEILAAVGDATTDFERSVLEDGEITRAEYVEASDRYLACMESHGVTMTAEDNFGVNQYHGANLSAEDEKWMDKCTIGTTMVIAGLYSDMIKYPDNGDFRAEIVECFIASGIAPKTFTVDDWEAAMPDNGEMDFPFDMKDPRFNECMSNPQTHQPEDE